MSTKRSVLVTGATGQQGGAVARALLASGHRVKALTRKPDSDAARQLKSAGADLVTGDLGDAASVRTAASGVNTMFLMGNVNEVGPEEETRQGIRAAGAAKAAGVGHLIYSSVADANKKTGIPHFDSKSLVEQHLAGLGVPYTISAPASFMENIVAPWSIGALSQGTFAFPMPPKRALQLIAVADIGAFVAALIERREAVFGKRFDLAGDELSGEEQVKSPLAGHGPRDHLSGNPDRRSPPAKRGCGDHVRVVRPRRRRRRYRRVAQGFSGSPLAQLCRLGAGV